MKIIKLLILIFLGVASFYAKHTIANNNQCYCDKKNGCFVPKAFEKLKVAQVIKLKSGKQYHCCASVEWGVPKSSSGVGYYSCRQLVAGDCDLANAIPANGCSSDLPVTVIDDE